jgi:hypothetical protein
MRLRRAPERRLGVRQQCCVVGSPRRSVLRLRVHQWRVLGLLCIKRSLHLRRQPNRLRCLSGPGRHPKPAKTASLLLRSQVSRLAASSCEAMRSASPSTIASAASLALRSASARADFASSSSSDSAFRADAAAAALSRASAHARRRAIKLSGTAILGFSRSGLAAQARIASARCEMIASSTSASSA